MEIRPTIPIMKTFLTLVLFSFTAMAGECKLTGHLHTEMKIETSFHTATLSSCKELAEKTKKNHFFNLVEENDKLFKTHYTFKTEEAQTQEVITFIEDQAAI